VNVLFLQLALFGYLGALLFFLADIAAPKDVFRRAGTRFLAGSLAAHALQIALTWISGSPPPALSMLAFLLAAGYLVLQRRYALRGPGIVASSSAALLYFASFLLDRGAGGDGVGGLFASAGSSSSAGVWRSVHLVFVLSGMASFFLAFVSAVLYLVKERALKKRLASALSQRLSSLETLDAVTSACMLAGLALLTFGIASGMLLNHAAHEMIWRWSVHEITALAPWTVLLVLFLVRVSAGWRGRRTAVLNVCGFTVTIAFLAIGLVGWA